VTRAWLILMYTPGTLIRKETFSIQYVCYNLLPCMNKFRIYYLYDRNVSKLPHYTSFNFSLRAIPLKSTMGGRKFRWPLGQNPGFFTIPGHIFSCDPRESFVQFYPPRTVFPANFTPLGQFFFVNFASLG